jgi:TPP-dependent pyruvate/acetoin dehydrogenase alpha subunit
MPSACTCRSRPGTRTASGWPAAVGPCSRSAARAPAPPRVIVVRSQLWPNGAPAEAGVLGDSVADRVRACGLWARRVDGADPVAVHNVIASAADRARAGRGPGIVDVVVTQQVHDPPAHRDPIERLRRFLDGRGEWTSTFQDVCEAEIRAQLEQAFAQLEDELSRAPAAGGAS